VRHYLLYLLYRAPLEPGDVHVVQKGFFVLHCGAASSTGEDTLLRWTFLGKNMSRTGLRHCVLQDNSLLVTRVQEGEGGSYSCVASNQYGESSSTAEVTVSSEWGGCVL